MGKSLAALVAIALAFTTACSAEYGGEDHPSSDDVDRERSAKGPAPGSSTTGSPVAQNAPNESTTGPLTTDLHHSEKGDPKNQPVVYIHGGPGANSMMFELTVHDRIAKLGYHVVSYDQRGSTRSPKGTSADHSFAKATQDLDDLISALGLAKPILLAHSFGGSIALHYLERFPGKAKGAILVASPIDFPQTYETTLTQCASRYRVWGRFPDAQKVDALRSKMFPQGVTPPFTYGNAEIEATIECQSKATLYFPPMPTQGDVQFGMVQMQNPNVSDVNTSVGSGFQANDKVGHVSYASLLAKHKNEVVGIYAPSWDVMFSKAQLATIQANVRSYLTVPDAGHFIFMDQPEAFTDAAAQALAQLK